MTQNYTDISSLLKKQEPAVGSINKETGPTLKTREVSEIQEVIEHEPDKDVEKFVKVHPETIKLPPDLKKIGVQSSQAPPKYANYQNIKLPISDDKVISGLHQPINSSLRWLATLALYLLKRAHLSLKVVSGKAVRVFKS